jgi:predicted NAD/FAD-binding protein
MLDRLRTASNTRVQKHDDAGFEPRRQAQKSSWRGRFQGRDRRHLDEPTAALVPRAEYELYTV